LKAIFLDRDGTINIDTFNGYINNPDDFCLFPKTAEAIKLFNAMGFKTIVVSNQSGVARGIVTIEQLNLVNKKMVSLLSENQAKLDLILFSPYLPPPQGITEPYNIHHISRKPGPGMFFEALHHFPIKAKKSFMIGDKSDDIAFGKSNGLTTILVLTGNGTKVWENRLNFNNYKPDFVVENLLSAAFLIYYLIKQ
jgi:D-glycero-D-manno-heptose 1,7-bisphosphate phosphatase